MPKNDQIQILWIAAGIALLSKIVWDWLQRRKEPAGAVIPLESITGTVHTQCPNHVELTDRVSLMESCNIAIKQKQSVHETLIEVHNKNISKRLDEGAGDFKDIKEDIGDIKEILAVLLDRSNQRREDNKNNSMKG